MTTLGGVLGSAFVCPVPSGNPGVAVEVLNTGWTDTNWNRVASDVDPGPLRLPFLVGKISHPRGTVVVDSGLGQETRSGHYPRLILKGGRHDVPEGATVVEQLGGLPAKVLLTHLHYDHVSGLLDMTPDVEVWTTLEEWRTARTSNVLFPARRMQDAVTWRPIELVRGQANQQLGAPAVDVYGDQTIWYLSTPGHTPGAASVLVRAERETWLFIGDIAWVDQHLDVSRRPGLVSLVVDGRPKELDSSLQWARAIRTRCPSLKIVAGHEPKWVDESP